MDDVAHLQDVARHVDDVDRPHLRKIGDGARGRADAEADEKHALELRVQRRGQVGEELHVALHADGGGGHGVGVRGEAQEERLAEEIVRR